MQFNRRIGQRYSTKIHREAEGRTLDIEIKDKDVSASELNVHVRKFTGENKISELDSNTIQLVTEELVVMVLLPKLKEGTSMQYIISHNRKNGVIEMGLGYPGEAYNPFEQEDNIFMVNIFREWISDIQFENEDNEFNELVLVIKGDTGGTEESEIEDVLGYQIAEDEAGDCAKTTEEVSAPGERQTFDFDGYRIGDRSVEAGSVAQNYRKSEAHIAEVLIRDESFEGGKWLQYLDSFLVKLDLEKGRIIFDSKVNTAQSAVRSVSKVLLLDIIEHCSKQFSFVACKTSYVIGEGEFVFKMRYPGDGYNPFTDGTNSRGVSIISRQTSVASTYKYSNKERINELTVFFYFMK